MTTDEAGHAALASIGITGVCDKHGIGEGRCKGTGFVCGAHPHQPPAFFIRGGCDCGATITACEVARTAPIMVRINVGAWAYDVLCKVSG